LQVSGQSLFDALQENIPRKKRQTSAKTPKLKNLIHFSTLVEYFVSVDL